MSQKPVIIAECCQNHNGDRTLLKDMIWAAAESGATVVKMQTIFSEELTHRERFDRGENAILRPYAPELERLRKLDLTEDDHRWFIEEARRAGVEPMTTVFTRARIPFVASLGFKSVKVASYDCASFPMIRELKERFDHLYVSTGATYDDEIRQTAAILKGHSFSLLHCVTLYPTALQDLNLARIEWLREFTPSVGYSDHSLVSRDGIKATVAAIAMGATVVERHFTILPADQSKDGPVSVNPAQLAEIARFAKMPQAEVRAYAEREIPEWKSMMGQATRPLTDKELLNRDYYRGRFASRFGGETVYNWEEKRAF